MASEITGNKGIQHLAQANIKENIKVMPDWYFLLANHRWPADSPHKGPGKGFQVMMLSWITRIRFEPRVKNARFRKYIGLTDILTWNET